MSHRNHTQCSKSGTWYLCLLRKWLASHACTTQFAYKIASDCHSTSVQLDAVSSHSAASASQFWDLARSVGRIEKLIYIFVYTKRGTLSEDRLKIELWDLDRFTCFNPKTWFHYFWDDIRAGVLYQWVANSMNTITQKRIIWLHSGFSSLSFDNKC